MVKRTQFASLFLAFAQASSLKICLALWQLLDIPGIDSWTIPANPWPVSVVFYGLNEALRFCKAHISWLACDTSTNKTAFSSSRDKQEWDIRYGINFAQLSPCFSRPYHSSEDNRWVLLLYRLELRLRALGEFRFWNMAKALIGVPFWLGNWFYDMVIGFMIPSIHFIMVGFNF